MSITSDIRAYTEQGRTQLTKVIDQAQTQLTDVSAKATGTIGDLRAQAEKTLNVAAIKSAVEPYLAQAKEYRNAVTDRASGIVDSVTSDKRVAKLVDTAGSVSSVVVETVTERVVKPVQNLTGTARKPATRPAAKKAAASKPASTRPAPKPTANSTAKPSARKTTANKATSTKA